MSLEEFLGLKKVLLCVGSGGVGKTTTAASIAVKLARHGHRVVVCTIDPARRLATSLGLTDLDNEERLVQEYGEGSLWAMMLDVKKTFDDVVRRESRDDESRDRILDNTYYRFASSALSLTQEFMAVEKLYELSTCGRYDIVVLDTPPTKNTLDFLKMPGLIVAVMDKSLVKWILKPYELMGKKGRGFFARGANKVFEGLGSVLGMQLLRDLSEFVFIMQGLVEGFHERATKVHELLRSVETGFVVVATARDQSVAEARLFYEEIEGMDADVIAVILNRLIWPEGPPDPTLVEDALAALPAELEAVARRELDSMAAEGRAEVANAARLAEVVPEGIIQRVPQFSEDIHDLEGLERYSELLA